MLGFPVQFVGAYSLELGEFRDKDLDVQVMTAVDPDADEEAKIWTDDWVIEIVESFGSL